MGTIVIYPVEAEKERPCLISLINELQKESNRNVTVIVPENATLEYEQSILRNENGMLGVSVKSLEKIQSSVIENYGFGKGYKNRKPIVATRNGMIAKTFLRMNEAADELRFCKNVRISSAEKVYDTIEDMRMHGYGKEELEKLSLVSSIPSLLRDKLHDICLVMDTKEDRSSSKSDTLSPADVFEVSCGQILNVGANDWDNVIFCGFDVLTAKMLSFCRSILLNSNKKIYMVFIKPDEGSKKATNKIFSELEDSINAAKKKLKKDKNSNISISMAYWDDKKTEGEKYDPAILYLSSIMLGNQGGNPDNMHNIKIYNAPNQYAECLHAVQQIMQWHEEGCAWKDMGVVMNMDDITASMLPLVMESAGVPYFLSSRQSSAQNTGVNYLLKAVCATNGYEKNNIIDIVKSGFLPFSEEEANNLEIYAVEHGITGNKWLKPFNNKNKQKKTDHLEELRKRVIAPIEKLHKEIADRKNGAKEQANAIWTYMMDTGFYDKLREKESDYRKKGMNYYAELTRQSWHIICKVLNTIASETTNAHISMENFVEILTKCLRDETMKSIPQTANAVLLGDAGSFVAGMRKRCVIISLQENNMPHMPGILTVADKKWMEANDTIVKVCPMFSLEDEDETSCKKMKRNQYRAIMSATEMLSLSCSAISHKGEPLTPDELIKKATEVVKELSPDNVAGGLLSDDILPFSKEVSIELLAQKIRDMLLYNKGDLSESETGMSSQLWKKVYSYLLKTEPERVEKIIKSINAVPKAENIAEETAQKLFRTAITSVSELEEFAACPYAHFIKYGIKPSENREYSFEVDQRGIFYHAALKAYIDEAKKNPDFPNIDQRTIIEIFNTAVRPLIEALKDTSLSETTLSRMELAEYVQTVRMSAIYVTYWLAKTKYLPRDCEMTFGKNDSKTPPLVLTLPNGHKVALAGSIDRVDVYTDPNGVEYGRIVDYKSSAHTLDMDDVNDGYQLQLPIYLRALIKANPGMKPAGAFYQQIMNNPVNIDSDDEAEVLKKVMSSTKLNGMYLVNENGELEKATGDSVKASPRSKSVTALNESEMENLLDTAQGKATEHAVNIENGKIEIAPRNDDKKNACEYCKNRNLCMIEDMKAFGGF